MNNDNQDDKQVLEQINVQIGIEESRGDEDAYKWFDGMLAPRLAFRRADRKTVDNREEFLSKVRPRDPRDTEIKSIELYGDRAVVSCIVTLKSEDSKHKFHNLRLFVLHEGCWKLLSWANEPIL